MENAKKLGHFLGFKTANSAFDIIELTRKGIKPSLVKRVIKEVDISQEEFTTYLHLGSRTLSRRFEKANELLTQEESEKVIRLARVFLEANEVFKNTSKTSEWLKRNNRALNNQSPISLLDSEIGAAQVFDVLGRIREGVYG